MRAGLLRHLITIQAKETTTTAQGTKKVTWEDFLQKLPAEYIPQRTREFDAANQQQSELTGKFRIRFRRDITEHMRVLFDGEPFDIVGKPVDVKGRRTMMELNVKNGVRDGK